MKLKLKPGIEPQGRRPFRIPEAYREELDNTISDLLKYKLIEPCESPYSNPIFLVPKPRRPDGSHAGMRLVWDGRGVNRAIESDSFLMPRVEDLIDRIARCKFEAERAGYKNMIFSGLDQRTSFWQLSLDEASRPLTAFSTSVGQYQWRCLPMGMLTSSAHLQRFTEALLRPFSRSNKFEYTNSAGERCVAYGTAVGYVDDIGVVTFGDIEAHEAYLRMVLGAMEASKLRIQPAKCEFFRSHGAFLGHVLSEEGEEHRAVFSIIEYRFVHRCLFEGPFPLMAPCAVVCAKNALTNSSSNSCLLYIFFRCFEITVRFRSNN